MQENEILDYAPQTLTKEVKEFRPVAIIIEAPFLFMTIVATLWGPESLLIIGVNTLSMLYFAMSWYLFKADKFRGWDLVFSILGGMALSLIVLGFLFQAANWEGAKEMVIISMTISIPAILALCIRFLLKRKNYLEYRLSLKLLSRILVFLLATLIM